MTQVTEQTAKITLTGKIREYAAYNLWANTTLVNWLKGKPSELMTQEIASSFPGIKETLIHIWDVQRFWLATLQKITPPPAFKYEGFSGNVADVYEGLVAHSQEFSDYVATLSENGLNEDCPYSIPTVGDFTSSRYDIIMQVMNHSSYHRGQVTTMGHHVDLHDAPMTDYMFYSLMVL